MCIFVNILYVCMKMCLPSKTIVSLSLTHDVKIWVLINVKLENADFFKVQVGGGVSWKFGSIWYFNSQSSSYIHVPLKSTIFKWYKHTNIVDIYSIKLSQAKDN